MNGEATGPGAPAPGPSRLPEWYRCAACGSPVTYTEWPSGDGRTYTCECGRSAGQLADFGQLDLGVLTPAERRAVALADLRRAIVAELPRWLRRLLRLDR